MIGGRVTVWTCDSCLIQVVSSVVIVLIYKSPRFKKAIGEVTVYL